MFKIPKWEDDVPKSKVDFGKTNKVQNKEKTVPQSPQKPAIPKKSANVAIKTLKKKFKKPKKNDNSPPKKINVSKENFRQSELKNGTSNNVINKKKKRPKKRKLEDSGTNDTKSQNKVNGSIKTSDAAISSKPKKKKRNEEDVAHEGSILLDKPSKKKKKKENHVFISEVKITKTSGSRVDKKKEKLRQVLQLETNRNKINVSGNNLRERMLERLKSAQFRFLNEKLYTTSGSDAQKLFQEDPEAFHTYHQGYQQQVKKWPVNPLDVVVKRIAKMPKTHVIADMGCGEAALSRRVAQSVRSFDLVASAPGVEPCDMAHTPLLAASTDAVVYCLALMGTDLTQYLLEANRVLKTGGHLLIAEVESRFDKVERFVEDVQRLGFKLKSLDKSHTVFFFLEFVKVRDPPAKKSKLPAIALKPCLYKRR